MRARPALSTPALAPVLSRLADRLFGGIEAWKRAVDGHRAAAALAQLDAHALKDIGLTRDDVLSAVDGSLAEDPTVRLQRLVRERRLAHEALQREAARNWR